MLATLTDRRFSDPEWLYERKLDGERCLAYYEDGKVRLQSRTGHDITTTYPEVVAAVSKLSGEGLLDGELVAFEGEADSFSRLQARLGLRQPPPSLVKQVPVTLCVFDLLAVRDYDLRQLALRHRKSVLGALHLTVLGSGSVKHSALQRVEHRYGEGVEFYNFACAHGWEGIIAKRASSIYRPGRSTDWLKFKCILEQEFVIGGYTDPGGSRQYLGAILVGYYEGDDLIYAGKVGTGFSEATLAQLYARLAPLEQPTSPFVEVKPVPKGVHWVRPELVAQIGFAEWTRDGRLRQPRFLGLRDDKPARSVVRERPTA
jgi:DNA ligase D-like protein (predicted ligase)